MSDCKTCAEYDSEKGYCPKYCEVIRKTVEELSQDREEETTTESRVRRPILMNAIVLSSFLLSSESTSDRRDEELKKHIIEIGEQIIIDADALHIPANRTQRITIIANISPVEEVTTVKYIVSRIADPRVPRWKGEDDGSD